MQPLARARRCRRAWLALALTAVACSSGDSGGGGGPEDSGLLPSGVPDSGPFTFDGDAGEGDAGALLASCNPGSAGSCPSGFTCYAQHTSSSWWVDLYGTCTFDCTDQTFSLCDSLDGVCGCPVPQGQASGNCSDDGGTALVCVPAVKPGTTPGSNDGEGGCGTPGCGGGPPVSGDASGDD